MTALTETGKRSYYIDWLRVLTMLAVFYFHNARVFDLEFWYIKNAQPSFGLTLFVLFSHQWIMPLFFLLAGAGSRFSLAVRGAGTYVKERFRRLAIPYAAGLFLLAPPQSYLQQLSRSEFQGSFPEYYPLFLQNLRLIPSPWLLGYGHHLWFIGFLLVFSLAALPFFLFLKGGPGRNLVSSLAGFCDRFRGGVLLFFIPLALVQAALQARFPGYLDWGNFFYWMGFFMLGYLLLSDGRFLRAAEREIAALLVVSAATLAAVFAMELGHLDWRAHFGYLPGYLAEQAVRSLSSWSLAALFLGAGFRFLNFTNRVLSYSNEAVMPFYLLHQPVIVFIAFCVVQWNIGIPAKFALVSTAAFLVIMALYELCVKRFNGVRFFFGMRPLKPASPAPGRNRYHR